MPARSDAVVLELILEFYRRRYPEWNEASISPQAEECANKLMDLIHEYGYSLSFAAGLIDPLVRLYIHVPRVPTKNRTKKNRPVSVKLYTNPHTGEVVRSKGGNTKRLMEWRSTYGTLAVSGWWRLEDTVSNGLDKEH